MPTNVTLANRKGKVEDLPGLDINEGQCVFPFLYKDEMYEDCFPGKKGAWCATEVNPKKKTVRKWAYCLKPGEKNPLDQGAPAAKPKETTKPKKVKKATKKKLPNPFSIPDESNRTSMKEG